MSNIAPRRLGDDTKWRQLLARFSWRDFVTSASTAIDRGGIRDPRARGLTTGAAAELAQELCRGIEGPEGTYDPHRPHLPWECFAAQRDVSKAASGGGFLIGSDVEPVEQALRGLSVVVDAGIDVRGGLVGDTTIPAETTPLVTHWLPNETTAVSGSTPTLAPIPMTPHMLGVSFDVSRLLLRLSGIGLDDYCRSAPLRAIGGAVDKAILQGSGADEPTGLISAAGIGTQAGTSFALSHAVAAREGVALASTNDPAVSWIGHPTLRKLLGARQRFTGVDSALWDNDLIDNRPARVTVNCPATTLICGDFSLITLGVFGPGPAVEVSQTTSQAAFMAAITSMRVIVGIDSAVRQPAAFFTTTSCT